MLRVLSYDLARSANKVAPRITIEAPTGVFDILNRHRPHLYVHDAAGGAATFLNCTIASGPSPIVLLAMDVLGNDGNSIFE